MDWRERIAIDARILAGKPIVAGTRISVELVIDLLGRGRSVEQILAEYDHLTKDDIQACLAYAGETLRSERVYLTPSRRLSREMALRLLLDENMPGNVVRDLPSAGYDVVSVKESMRGADDSIVLAKAQAEIRVVLTMDKDSGELAVRHGLPAASGVMLFRLSGTNPGSDRHRILEVVAAGDDWSGHFAVVTDDRVRMRLLSPTS